MRSFSPLVFVYLGEFPRYGVRAITMATETSGVPVLLLTDEEVPTSIRKWSIRTQDFYDPQEFDSVSHAVSRNPKFRNGFWQKALERLFVLKQFQRIAGHNTLFHAELDNLVFRLDRFESVVGRSLPDETLTLPFGSPEVALASLMHIRGLRPLAELIGFAGRGHSYLTEMHLLAAFAHECPGLVVQAPSLESLTSQNDFRNDPARQASIASVGANWMFDAAALGQWVAGQDVANHSGLFAFNHFTNEAIAHYSIRPRTWLTDDGSLNVEIGDQHITSYNLHLHHKLHNRLSTLRHLRVLLCCARVPVRLPIAVNATPFSSAFQRVGSRVQRDFKL